MPTEIVRVSLADGSSVPAEVDIEVGQIGEAGILDGERGEIDFRQALQKVRTAAGEMLAAMRDMAERPDSCEITFGVKLSAAAGAIIAKAGAEANFTVKLGWSGKSHSG